MRIDRHDPATAIPLLAQMVESLNGKTEHTEKLAEEAAAQKMYRVDIIASQGNLLRGGIESTTLIARLSSWDKDITAEVEDNYFIWSRNSGDEETDAQWNADHITGAKHIEVTLNDVDTQATFFCTVKTSDGITAEAQITVVNYTPQEEAQANINRIDGTIIDLQQNSSEMQEVINGLNDRTNQNTNDVTDIRALFVGLESTVDSIDKNKASLEDLAGVEQKFDAVFQKTPEGLKIIGVDGYEQKSIISLLLTYDRLVFKENGVTVAYISNENLNIENAIIRNQLTVGEHEITTDGSSFELVYVGGES